jgi:hypothetical protein
VEDLESKLVHTSTLLRLVLPDRTAATALFSPTATIGDVASLVKSLLASPGAQTKIPV